VLTARNIAEATDKVGRAHLWRACEMMLRGSGEGGRLYLEVVLSRGEDDPFVGANHLRTLAARLVVGELEERGATVLHREVVRVEDESPEAAAEVTAGHRIGRWVVEWQR